MSSKGMPSLAALLGLLAVAGYQNRDKLRDLFNGAVGSAGVGGAAPSAGGILGDIVDRFRNAGAGAAADSWVGKGANQPVNDTHTASALGPDLIDQLVKQTGLSREELLARLSKVLPETVDTMTPDGRIS